MTDHAANRRIMVDTQVRPSDVTKYSIIDAMLSVPKERFVPVQNRQTAYVDDNIPLGAGRTILAPRTFAKMLDALDLRPVELVLDIGCGLGYSTAVIARLCEAVVALEEDAAMAGEAEGLLSDIGADNTALAEGPLVEGAAGYGPYDAIVIEGAVETLPEALTAQLKEGGRIVCLFRKGALGQARLGVKTGGVLGWRWLFDASVPLLPGFAQEREFVL